MFPRPNFDLVLSTKSETIKSFIIVSPENFLSRISMKNAIAKCTQQNFMYTDHSCESKDFIFLNHYLLEPKKERETLKNVIYNFQAVGLDS